MSLTRGAAQTIAQILTLARAECADPKADADGNTLAITRWTDDEYQACINQHLLDMATRASLANATAGLTSVDQSYTAGSDTDTVALSASVGPEAIFGVDDVTDSTNPRPLKYISPAEIETIYREAITYTEPVRYWSLVEDAAGAFFIKVRPRPVTALTLRVRFYAPGVVASATTDAPLLSARWQEFIALGAAVRLLSRDDEVATAVWKRLAALDATYTEFCRRVRGPFRVRASRRAFS